MRMAVSGSRMQPVSGSSSATQARTHRYLVIRRNVFIRCSLSVGYEDVALVAYGADEPRMLGVGLDLLAQPHDAQVHAAVERIPITLLLEIQDTFTRKSPVRVFRKRLQQIELERRHRHLCPLLIGEPMRGEVEHAASDPHAFGAEVGAAGGRRAPKYALDAGQQLARGERLGGGNIGAPPQAPD